MENKNIFPGWEIVELIGSGGFSKVYKIKKTDAKNTCFYSALKIIDIPQTQEEYKSYRADGYDNESITKIFDAQVKDIVREFELMHEFRGVTNIVSFEDHLVIPKEDSVGWRILIRMELLQTLPDWYMENSFTDEDVRRLGIDICRALKRCAKKNIVHRDLKPQNIFANDFDDFKLGDFGVARVMDHATRATKIGTYSYMAPEVFNNEPYSVESDIYSLGLTLYWLLNERRLPFLPLPPAVPTPTVNNEAQMRRLNGEPIPAPKYGSDELKAVVLKACAFNPKDRYSSAAEFEKALSAVSIVGAICNPSVAATLKTEIKAEPTATEATGGAGTFDDEKTASIFTGTAQSTAATTEATGGAGTFDDEKTASIFSSTAQSAAATEATGGTSNFDDEKNASIFGSKYQNAPVTADIPIAADTVQPKVEAEPSEPAVTEATAGASTFDETENEKTISIFSVKEQSTSAFHDIEETQPIDEKPDIPQPEIKEDTEPQEEEPAVIIPDAPKADEVKEEKAKEKAKEEPVVIPPDASKEQKKSGKGGKIALAIGAIAVVIVVVLLLLKGCGKQDGADGADQSSPSNINISSNISDSSVVGDSSCEINGHSFGEWETVKEATCASEGEKARTCSVCNNKETEAIPVSDHQYVDDLCKYCGVHKLSEGLEYTLLDDGTYAVGVGTCTDTNIYIPSVYNGKAVTIISDEAFIDRQSITSVTIPDSVTSIGGWAFEGCTSLASIIIPNNVTSIGGSAFGACESLTSITIPDSVTSIGDWAFFECTSLTSIAIPDSVTYIGDWAFHTCTSLTSITIPNSVTYIGCWAFENCTSLKSIYCEADSKPSGWNEKWNSACDAKVYWNGKLPVSSNPVLISGGMDYEYPTNESGTHGARTYTGNLTDGYVPEDYWYQPEWFGLFNNIAATSDSNALNGYGDFVFDLGSVTDLAKIIVVNGNDGSFQAPTMTVYVSNDKSNWTEAGTLDSTQETESIYLYSANLTGTSARYVKVRVTVPDETYWTFIAEIEIYADGN